jgi:hypothetical protein
VVLLVLAIAGRRATGCADDARNPETESDPRLTKASFIDQRDEACRAPWSPYGFRVCG